MQDFLIILFDATVIFFAIVMISDFVIGLIGLFKTITLTLETKSKGEIQLEIITKIEDKAQIELHIESTVESYLLSKRLNEVTHHLPCLLQSKTPQRTISWEEFITAEILKGYQSSYGQEMKRSLSPQEEVIYSNTLESKTPFPTRPENLKELSVRTLQRHCQDINRVVPGTIKGYRSKGVNKRQLVKKLEDFYAIC